VSPLLRQGLGGLNPCQTARRLGKTIRSFRKECFELHKKNLYSKALNISKSQPYFFFVAPIRNDGTLSMAKYPMTIGFIEKYLIGLALRANDKLLNQIDTKIHRELELPGFFNERKDQERDAATKTLRRAFGFE
jgi:hypothetical protein